MYRTRHMLFVDDSAGDRDLAQEALEGSVNLSFHAVCDGEEALKFLHRQGEFKHSPRPHVILLDINMPGKSGLEVLREVKKDDALRSIPVVIFSSSTHSSDMRQAYEASANAYVVKPSTLDEFLNVLKQIEHFWQQVVTVP